MTDNQGKPIEVGSKVVFISSRTGSAHLVTGEVREKHERRHWRGTIACRIKVEESVKHYHVSLRPDRVLVIA